MIKSLKSCNKINKKLAEVKNFSDVGSGIDTVCINENHTSLGKELLYHARKMTKN